MYIRLDLKEGTREKDARWIATQIFEQQHVEINGVSIQDAPQDWEDGPRTNNPLFGNGDKTPYP